MGDPLITKSPGIHGGAPCIAGTRITVSCLLGCRDGGWDDATILRNYPTLTVEQLDAAFAYAEEHAEEFVRREPTTGADGDGLVHVRHGRIVHVGDGLDTYLPRSESITLALEVLGYGADMGEEIEGMRRRASTLVDDEDPTICGQAKEILALCGMLTSIRERVKAQPFSWLAQSAGAVPRDMLDRDAALAEPGEPVSMATFKVTSVGLASGGLAIATGDDPDARRLMHDVRVGDRIEVRLLDEIPAKGQ